MKIDLFVLATITFLVLKLTHVIAWSWWLVFLPLWGPLAIAVVFAIVMLVAMI